jgi:hypothetical protein
LRAEFRRSAPDAGKIPGVLGMQNVLKGVSMAVGVVEMALYSSYTQRLLWLEPTGWRSEYEQTPREVDIAVHAYYLALKGGDTSDAVLQGLSRLENQARDHLDIALFRVSGKLDAALAGKLRVDQ